MLLPTLSHNSFVYWIAHTNNFGQSFFMDLKRGKSWPENSLFQALDPMNKGTIWLHLHSLIFLIGSLLQGMRLPTERLLKKQLLLSSVKQIHSLYPLSGLTSMQLWQYTRRSKHLPFHPCSMQCWCSCTFARVDSRTNAFGSHSVWSTWMLGFDYTGETKAN